MCFLFFARVGCYREELWSSRGEVKREWAFFFFSFLFVFFFFFLRRRFQGGIERRTFVGSNGLVGTLTAYMLDMTSLRGFGVNLRLSVFLPEHCSSHICNRWNPFFQHLDSSRSWTPYYYRAHGVPDVILGEALQAHHVSLRRCRYHPASVTASSSPSEGWCLQSGVGVFVVRYLLRGDTGAWPTQI